MDEIEFRRRADAAIEDLKQSLIRAEDEIDMEAEEQGGALVYDPQVAYVVVGDDGLVQVASQMFSMPETDRMSWARLPRAGATAASRSPMPPLSASETL